MFFNDKIQKSDDISKNEWNKQIKEYLSCKKNGLLKLPAVKIGRLVIEKNFKKKGYDTYIILLVKETFSSETNKTGCKYITVDSYKNSKKFYENQEFRDYLVKTQDKNTILMYLNLSNLSQ